MPEDALRIAAAILAETVALVVWNIGSRSPRRLLGDARAAATSPRRLFWSVMVAFLGAIFFLVAIVLLVPILDDTRNEFSPVIIGTLFVALFVDFLIGNDLRALVFSRREPHP